MRTVFVLSSAPGSKAGGPAVWVGGILVSTVCAFECVYSRAMNTTFATLCLKRGEALHAVTSSVFYPVTRQSSAYERAYPSVFAAKEELFFYPMKPDRWVSDILEIGPGRGDFLFALAAACRDRQIAAVEMGGKRYYKLVRQVEARGLTNVLLINGDARLVVPQCVPRMSLSAVYVWFPDPWPKRRHAFHRLLTQDFLDCLAACLKPGGVLTVRTDVRAYAEWVRASAAGIPALRERRREGEADTLIPGSVETLYEQRRRAAGETITTVSWCKEKCE